jgi:hypothetical protein
MNSSISRYVIDVTPSGRSSYWRVLLWGSLFAFSLATAPHRIGTFFSGALLWESVVASIGADLFPKVRPHARFIVGVIPFAIVPALFASICFVRGSVWNGLFWAVWSSLGFFVLAAALKWKGVVELAEGDLRVRAAWRSRIVPYNRVKSVREEHFPVWLRLLYPFGSYAVIELEPKPGFHLPWSGRLQLTIDNARLSEFIQEITSRMSAARSGGSGR